MVKITLLNRDQYDSAIAVVETVPKGSARLTAGISVAGQRDVSIELARQGFAELYTGRRADYFVRDPQQVHNNRGPVRIVLTSSSPD